MVALVTRCAVTDGADLSGLLEEQLLAAAHVRCRVLLATVGAPPVSAPQPCCLIRLRMARACFCSPCRSLWLRNAAAQSPVSCVDSQKDSLQRATACLQARQ